MWYVNVMDRAIDYADQTASAIFKCDYRFSRAIILNLQQQQQKARLISWFFIASGESFCMFGHNHISSLHDNCINNCINSKFCLVCQWGLVCSHLNGSGPTSYLFTKKGLKKLPENYRPVSLLPICSKITGKVVCEGLLEAYLPALPDSQHGFLPKRSCISNLACFLEHCWASLTEGSQTDAIYTDYSSVFTSVNHRLLLLELRHSFSITGRAYCI